MVIQMKLETVFQIQSKVLNKCDFYKKVYSFYIPFVMLCYKSIVHSSKKIFYVLSKHENRNDAFIVVTIVCLLVVSIERKTFTSSNQLFN